MSILDSIYNNQPQTPVNQGISQIAQMRSMMDSIRNSGNPQAFIQNMAATNPAVQQAVNLINQNGGNPQTAALNYAKQNGIDINNLLQALGRK